MINNEDLKKSFENSQKKILFFKTDKNRTLPTDTNKLANYAIDLINAYNALVAHTASVYPTLSTKSKNNAENSFISWLRIHSNRAVQ